MDPDDFDHIDHHDGDTSSNHRQEADEDPPQWDENGQPTTEDGKPAKGMSPALWILIGVTVFIMLSALMS